MYYSFLPKPDVVFLEVKNCRLSQCCQEPCCGSTVVVLDVVKLYLAILNDKSRFAAFLCVNVQILDTGLGKPLKN